MSLSTIVIASIFLSCAACGPRSTRSIAILPSLEADSTYSGLVGTVQDSVSRRPLGGAQVLLRNSSAGDLRSAESDDSGGFIVKRLPSGSYTVQIRKIGYYPYNALRTLTKGRVDTLRVLLKSGL